MLACKSDCNQTHIDTCTHTMTRSMGEMSFSECGWNCDFVTHPLSWLARCNSKSMIWPSLMVMRRLHPRMPSSGRLRWGVASVLLRSSARWLLPSFVRQLFVSPWAQRWWMNQGLGAKHHPTEATFWLGVLWSLSRECHHLVGQKKVVLFHFRQDK